jgi:predicted DNA binding CopG/RHH family protein
MNDIKKPTKAWPSLPSDEAAAAFVETADLSEYDWSQAQPITMEHRRKDSQLNVRLPAEELTKVREAADREGIPLSRFVRLMIERGMMSLKP